MKIPTPPDPNHVNPDVALAEQVRIPMHGLILVSGVCVEIMIYTHFSSKPLILMLVQLLLICIIFLWALMNLLVGACIWTLLRRLFGSFAFLTVSRRARYPSSCAFALLISVHDSRRTTSWTVVVILFVSWCSLQWPCILLSWVVYELGMSLFPGMQAIIVSCICDMAPRFPRYISLSEYAF